MRQRIQELESQGSKAFAMINQIGEETLEAINDLSEDTRKELDSIYLALSELADKEKTESLNQSIDDRLGLYITIMRNKFILI